MLEKAQMSGVFMFADTDLKLDKPQVEIVVDRDKAWDQVKSVSGFGPGGSKSNSLFWVASRPPPLSGYNGTAKAADPKGAIKAPCASNSACDAMGLVGQCCPTDPTTIFPGTMLGCCPSVHRAGVGWGRYGVVVVQGWRVVL